MACEISSNQEARQRCRWSSQRKQAFEVQKGIGKLNGEASSLWCVCITLVLRLYFVKIAALDRSKSSGKRDCSAKYPLAKWAAEEPIFLR